MGLHVVIMMHTLAQVHGLIIVTTHSAKTLCVTLHYVTCEFLINLYMLSNIICSFINYCTNSCAITGKLINKDTMSLR